MPPFRRVADMSDLASFSMKAVELDKTSILLVRRGDSVTAIGGTCPHAGGPLAEGVLDGGSVICPWHKAAFCVQTGRRLEPPAVDDVPRFDVEIRDGGIFVAGPAEAAKEARAPDDPRCFVVIGGGAAGAAAVQELREQGFSGRIVLVDREGELPYDRTVLSKYALSGTEGGEKTPLHDAAFYTRHAIERRREEVAAVNPARRAISFAGGGSLSYDAALIATGAAPREAPFPGGKLRGVFLLRSKADAARIVDASRTARHAVVIGSGFIGMEVAGSLTERGLGVTIVSRDAVPFEKQLGPRVGAVFRRIHAAKGVQFRMASAIDRLDGADSVEAVVLKDGSRIAADLVVAGLGVRPLAGFVEGIAPAQDGGLRTDACLRIAPSLFAAGDIAAFPLGGDGEPVRVEHWRVAEQHGRTAARNMLGVRTPYDAVPVFWTIHYGMQLDYVGHASAKDELVVRGTLGEDGQAAEFIAYYLHDGAVTAAAGLGRDRDMAAVVALMGRRRRWTADALHPPDASPADVLRADGQAPSAPLRPTGD
jgi:NADPH-dependent 2,4-dienoyl-CoA reductase/sulfur reductase-like enzyme/nitrite reductase/ring-hydroxylating ferredoxin subunit